MDESTRVIDYFLVVHEDGTPSGRTVFALNMIHEILSGENNDPPPYPIAHIVAALEYLALDIAWEEQNQQLNRESQTPEDN